MNQVDRSEVFGDSDMKCSGVGIKMTEMQYKMPSLNGVLTDLIFLQNLPSMSVAKILNPLPGSRVLDMCAAPGGKTCHLAAIMNNTGEIFALDKMPKKAAKIQENCDLLGVKNVHVMATDSSKLISKKFSKPNPLIIFFLILLVAVWD